MKSKEWRKRVIMIRLFFYQTDTIIVAGREAYLRNHIEKSEEQ